MNYTKHSFDYSAYQSSTFNTIVIASAVAPAVLCCVCSPILATEYLSGTKDKYMGLLACQYFGMTITYLLAIMGVIQPWRSRAKINLLRLHVIFMLCIDAIFITLKIQAEMDRIHSQSILNRSFSVWGLIFFLAFFIFLNIPLLLIAGSGRWFPSLKSVPIIDYSGRYLRCVNCDYDLRGTPGTTCPECGAPTKALINRGSNETPTTADS